MGKTLGVVGLGRIGGRVAEICGRGLRMKVIAYDPYITPQRFTEQGAAPVDLETLLRSADVVTFHVPENAETFPMLNRQTMEFLKPTAIVINAARGGHVVDADLIAALDTGHLAAAQLDDVRAKIADLKRMERVLKDVVAQCADGTRPECPLIGALFRERTVN